MSRNIYNTGQLLFQLGNAVAWFRNRKLQAAGLTSSQSGLLLYILHHQDETITVGTLMTKLNLSKSTVSGIIKRLEQKFFLMRRSDTADARKSRITLTDEAIELEEYLKRIAEETEEKLLMRMSEEEKEQFSHLLQIALENMNVCRISGEKDADKRYKAFRRTRKQAKETSYEDGIYRTEIKSSR